MTGTDRATRASWTTWARAGLVLAAFLLVTGAAGAAIHPKVELLDSDSIPVLESGLPVSTMTTCGRCHDTEYIDSHSYHVSLASSYSDPDGYVEPQGAWDPLTYDGWDLATDGKAGPADWLLRNGAFHVGGGPARSAGLEMDCFLCHLRQPDAEARNAEISAGNFGWATTATLAATGIVERHGDGWAWNRSAFDDDGLLNTTQLSLGDPANANCGQCHGAVGPGDDSPFFLAPDLRHRKTATTGEIVAPNRIRRSGMNIAGKDSLSRSWDVHAERLVTCTSCHPSINNPSFYRESAATRPTHLKTGARGLNLGEYLQRPSHDFAKGDSSQGFVGREVAGTMHGCEDCHELESTHQWLPYQGRHLQELQCEACHVPRLFAAALQQVDWTVVTPDGGAAVAYRGVDGDPADPRALIQGYQPVLLPRAVGDDRSRLAPQNLIATWYWREEGTGRPVPRSVLEDAFLGDDGAYRPQILDALDTDGDRRLSPQELRLVTPAAVAAVRQTLLDQGAESPSIHGEIRPYGVHHGIAAGNWATRDCQACHGSESRFTQAFPLAGYVPGGVVPALVAGTSVNLTGSVEIDEAGGLVYRPDTTTAGIFLLGFRHHKGVDLVGRWAVILTLIGVLIHGSTRLFISRLARRRRRRTQEAQA